MKKAPNIPLRALAPALLAALAALPLSGCIRSRVRITSDPPQAEVIFNGEPRGVTPIEIPFIWYWHHEVIVQKEGYVTSVTDEHLRTPPWFLLPLDLFAEIIPVPIPDTRERHYTLEKVAEKPL